MFIRKTDSLRITLLINFILNKIYSSHLTIFIVVPETIVIITGAGGILEK